MILGTHTSDEQNHFLIASVQLPNEDADLPKNSDFGQILTITTSLEKFKIREKEVSNLESPTHLELYDQKKSLSSESESSGNEKVTIKFIFVNS